MKKKLTKRKYLLYDVRNKGGSATKIIIDSVVFAAIDSGRRGVPVDAPLVHRFISSYEQVCARTYLYSHEIAQMIDAAGDRYLDST